MSPLDDLTTWLEKHPDDGYLLEIHYYHYDKPGVWRVNLEQHDDLKIGTEADTIQEAADRLFTKLEEMTPPWGNRKPPWCWPPEPKDKS